MDLVGPEGTWSGWFDGTEYNWTGESKTDLNIVLTGSGAYEGLVTVQHATGPFWGPMTLAGVIYAGDPPPAPEMPMPAE